MFKNISAVTYPVPDLTKAKEWYTKLLSIDPVFESPFVIIYTIGGCTLTLLKEASKKMDNSEVTLYWEVESVAESFEKLLQLGAKEVTPVQTVMNTVLAKLRDPFGTILGIRASKISPEKQGIEKVSSETAKLVTFCRSLSLFESITEVRGNDTLAHHFLSPQYQKALETEESRTWAKEKLGALYGFSIARTKYGDSLFQKALKENISQIVILGAGYDTRPYRYRELLGETSIFEVDAPATQRCKCSLLKDNHISIPPSIKYVPLNFRSDSLLHLLQKSGYDSTEKTLFIWEGVSQYLPKEAIHKTLQFIQYHSALGSTLYFDFLTEEQSSSVEAEPFLFWISPENLKKYLHQFSIKTKELLSCEDIEKQYLSTSDGYSNLKSVPYFSFFYGEKV